MLSLWPRLTSSLSPARGVHVGEGVFDASVPGTGTAPAWPTHPGVLITGS